MSLFNSLISREVLAEKRVVGWVRFVAADCMRQIFNQQVFR
jgi:hypothetical protein